ncbi:hypothetical protein EJB05_00926, partial [Eragrostis curvula]
MPVLPTSVRLKTEAAAAQRKQQRRPPRLQRPRRWWRREARHPDVRFVPSQFVGMEHWRRIHLDGGGESNAPSSMKNKVLQPLLCLVMVFLDHNCGLVRVWFPVTFIWMLLGFMFSHCEYGEGGDDGLGYGLDDGEFFILVCGISVYRSLAKGLGFSFPPSDMRMTVVDGEMIVFYHIGVFVRGISVWDGDPRWWNL